jgi:protocatechuate 3,4-dioxygenase alpha subunit
VSAEVKLIPTSSQTVGPYFRIGLRHLAECDPEARPENRSTITISGSVLDRDRAPVPDAMLEFWSPGVTRPAAALVHDAGRGEFKRVATDIEGRFSVEMRGDVVAARDAHNPQAPHILVLVFARGLLRHLISRVYFDEEPANGADPVLLGVPAERRRTLIAQRESDNVFRWDVILQGTDETVFFAW